MASNSKLEADLELALYYYESLAPTILAANTGTTSQGEWELIVKYHGDIQVPAESVGARVEILNESFAIVTINPSRILEFVDFFQIEYAGLPKRMFYILRESFASACLTNVHSPTLYNLRGEGVLLGIIDSGITYTHPDFRNEDGTTRIAYLWDQTISGSPPAGFSQGTEYTREQINEALAQPTIEETLALVPSIDESGHGTAVAGVAGGNGRASGGREVGVAPEAEFVVVKIGMEGENSFPRTIEVMRALKYVTQKAIELGRPIAINIGLGMTQGGHDGRSLLERYIDEEALRSENSIVVGTGNQGNQVNHTMGVVEQDGENTVQFTVSQGQNFYAFTLWKSFIDDFEIRITSPGGEQTDRIGSIPNNQSYILGNTNVFINYSEPSLINEGEEILVYFEPRDTFVDPGIWTLTIYGVDITNGTYHIWGATEESTGGTTSFFNPMTNHTLTIPSTGSSPISVGTLNAATGQVAAFSGRGFTRDNRVKPDLIAPGVNVIAPNNQGEYSSVTGSSIAAAFVTGGAALLLEWGLVKGNDRFLYGDRLKSYLLKNTRRLSTSITYPDPLRGYGALCLENVLRSLINR